jgi:hypothetical protein
MTQPVKRRATLLDAVHIAANLRDQDRREIEASHGPEIREALIASLMASEEAWVWTLDEKPICIAGFSKPALPGPFSGAGSPWMLGTPEMTAYPKLIVREGRWIVQRAFDKKYPCLFNFVHAENTAAIAWLKHLGFTFGNVIPEYGVAKQPFILFYRYNDVS